jgi:hypothetical protein
MAANSNRTIRVLRFAIVALALALAGLGPRPAAARQGNPYGVNIHSPTGADLELTMSKLQAAGIGWAHVAVIWPYVEGTEGSYDWSAYDAIVASAKAHGIQILATILYTPSWATSDPNWTGVPNTAAWVTFCSTAARRYKSSITYWGIWNEPNSTEFWAGTRQQYITQLLQPGSEALHAGNPDAKVGGPALAHVGSQDWYDWLDDVITQAGGQLDFVTHHVYDSDGNREVTSRLNGSTLFGDTPSLWSVVNPSVREVLKHAGWFGKPFWLTETGWQSAPIGEPQQAAYISGILGDWFTGIAGQTWIDQMFIYEMVDSPPNDTTWGILHADGTPKQSYFAYQAFIAARQPAKTDGAKLIASNLPITMDAGQTITVSLTYLDSGTSTWTAAAGYQLGAPSNADPFAATRQALAPGASIAPGGQTTFTFNFTAPATAGTYTTHWQMVREGVDWFGDEASQQVVVNPAPALAQRTLPLQTQRFAVNVSWHDPQSGNAGFGHPVPLTDETGTFWFFTAANTELVIKLLDARSVDKHFWFFYGALSEVEYWITVTDLLLGTTATYHNPPGELCGGADTSTFGSRTAGGNGAAGFGMAGGGTAGFGTAGLGAAGAALTDRTAIGPRPVAGGAAATRAAGRWVRVSPGAAAAEIASAALSDAPGSCVASGQNLCLLADRFRVSVAWTAQGTSGTGGAASLSDQTGTFAFFDPAAVDLVVKVLDGRSVNGDFWFFYGALSDVAYTITLTDTVTGSTKQYQNQQGNLCGQADTSALK